MPKVCSVLLLAFCLSACATVPAFQKSGNGNEGYKIQDLASKDHFQVAIQLPEVSSDKFIRDYGFRAVGEECATRGFHYFDVGELEAKHFEGYCFPDSTRKALAINFLKKGLAESPRRFVVEDLNGKTNTQLQLNDEILAIDMQSPVSMAHVKSLVFAASSSKRVSLPIKIKRQGRELTVTEPIADFKNGALGESDLEALRALVR